MKVVYDEQSLFTLVTNFLVDLRFVYPARNRACKEGTIVNTAHIVTSSSERKWNPQDENCSVNPRGVVPTGEHVPFEYIGREHWGNYVSSIDIVIDVI